MSEDIEELKLSKPPLVEAIFELRWKLHSLPTGGFTDPNYSIFVGRFQSAVESKFPHWEKLPLAAFPEDALPYMPRHRFRSAPNDWPLLQTGPGLLTVNDTQRYDWTKFKNMVTSAVDSLLGAYPDSDNLVRISLMHLRYLNAHPLDDLSATEFLKQKMNVNAQLPEQLFKKAHISGKPEEFSLDFVFSSLEPPGQARISFRQAKKVENNEPMLAWETTITAKESDVPVSAQNVGDWVEKARAIGHHWFLALTQQHLLDGYK